MFNSVISRRLLSSFSGEQLSAVLRAFTASNNRAERARVLAGILRDASPRLRDEIGQSIAGVLSVEKLVPDAYSHWRRLVHDAMVFYASRISAERLATKIVEQIELPVQTSIES